MTSRAGRIPLRIFLFLAVPIWAGCSPGDSEEPTVEAVNAEQFRSEVTMALDEIHAELTEIQERISPIVDESLSDLANSTQSATSELMADLDRLATATAEEARAIQEAAANRLAELEAEVIRAEISAAPGPDSLVTVANDRLGELESDIETIASETAAEEVESAPSIGMPIAQDEHVMFMERITDLRTAVEEVSALPAAEFEESREDLSMEIAQLTHEVRRRWYEEQWGIEG